MTTKLTNNEFSKTSKLFKASCEAAGIPATKRQASKFRLGKGLAFKSKPAEIKPEGGEQ